MINLDFSLAISLYSIIILSIIFLFWLFSREKENRGLSLEPQFIWFCSVCSYTYINTKEEAISTCPRCGSYNKKQVIH